METNCHFNSYEQAELPKDVSESWKREAMCGASSYLVQHCLCQSHPKRHGLKVCWGSLRGKLSIPLLYSECTIGL